MDQTLLWFSLINFLTKPLLLNYASWCSWCSPGTTSGKCQLCTQRLDCTACSTARWGRRLPAVRQCTRKNRMSGLWWMKTAILYQCRSSASTTIRKSKSSNSLVRWWKPNIHCSTTSKSVETSLSARSNLIATAMFDSWSMSHWKLTAVPQKKAMQAY